MRVVTKILTLLNFVSCGFQSQLMNEERFTNYYFECISNKYPGVTYEISSSLTLKATKDGKEVFHYLDNVFKEYKLEPKRLKETIDKYVEGSEELYKEQIEIDINRIVPMIKPKKYLEIVTKLREEIKTEKSDLVWETYNEELIIIYAEDKEKSISYFNQEDFEKSGIERRKLKDIAIENLSEIIPKIEKSGDEGNYMLIAGGTFEASMILMKDIWNSDNFKVDGEIVIAIPNRDLVFITGSNNSIQIERLEKIVEESYENGNHSITSKFFKWNGEKFMRK